MKHILVTTLPAILLCSPAASADQDNNTPQDEHLEEIVITSRGLSEKASEIARSIKILASEALERRRALTLGDTLDTIPGLSQASFGPAVSRPVIRGIGGDRIRILTNGIGTIDASTTSPDHGLAVDLAQAEQVEIFRGPATLLFGSNAVGGAINVFDGRIPIQKVADGSKTNISTHYGTNGNERTISAGTTFNASGNLVIHGDASYLKRSDLDIPGLLVSREAIEDALVEAAEEGEELHIDEIPRSEAPNTQSEKYSLAFGSSLFFDNGFIGASISYYDNKYGLPTAPEGFGVGHGHAEEEGNEEEEGPVVISQDQTRFDLIGEIEADLAIFDKIKVRFGYGDYSHVELEGDEIGTRFLNDGYEGRIELTQKDIGNLSGVIGIHHRNRDFEAVGEEAFVPPSETEQTAVFLIEKYRFDDHIFELGGRIEDQSIKAPLIGFDRDDTNYSISGATIWSLSDTFTLALTGFRTERAPNAEELLSNGPHLATATFELGDANLGKETAKGFEARLEFDKDNLSAAATYFYTRYDDFIFQDFTGDVEDSLPVAQYTATDAKFEGFEGEVNFRALKTATSSITLNLTTDYVKATDRITGTALPRIPPFSISGEILAQTSSFDIETSLTYSTRKSRVANLELPTGDYLDLQTAITYHPSGPDSPLSFYVKGKNLLDQDIRHATSFLKDTLPSAGISVIFGISASL